MNRRTLDRILDARAKRAAHVVLTDLTSFQKTVMDDSGTVGDLALSPDLETKIVDLTRRDQSGVVVSVGRRVFVEVANPPLRLAIIGAVHISQALAPMAALAGYDVTVIDPRRAFATDERFPGITVSTDWPDDGLAAFAPDRRSAVVTLTHDPKLDDPALEVALGSDAFYIASLGSTRTHAARKTRLAEAGFAEDQIARIHGPAGLALGAVSPAEIAVSVLAQMTAALRQGAVS